MPPKRKGNPQKKTDPPSSTVQAPPAQAAGKKKQRAATPAAVAPPREVKIPTPAPAPAATAQRTQPVAPLPSSQTHQLAHRPPSVPPKDFRKCTVNHYPLEIRADAVFQYQVDFTPDTQRKGTRRSLLDQHRDVLGTQFLFDGQHLLFTTCPLEDQTLDCNLQGKDYQLMLQNTKQYNPQEVPAQVYALLFRTVLRHLDLTALGRQHYRPQQAVRMPQYNMELWPGFNTSIHSVMKGASLCADLAHKIIRTDTVLDMMNKEWDRSRDSATAERNIAKILEGQVVLTRYNNRTYRVDEIDWDLTPMSCFDRKGKQCTFVQYYKSTYQLGIRDLKQPLLKNIDRRSQQEVLLVPELCYLTGLTDEMRKDFRLMADLATHTRVEPSKRFKELADFSGSIERSNPVQEALSEWKVKASSEAMKVMARHIPPETVSMGQKRESAGPKAAWNVTSLVETVAVRKCIFIYPSEVRDEAGELLSHLKTEADKLRITFAKPVEVMIQRDDARQFEQAIRKNVTKETTLVLCMLKYDSPQSYSQIKLLCCHELGIPSQCVRAKTMGKPGRAVNPRKVPSIVTKIVQQINCKIGGESWRVQIPGALAKTMIVGIDVCHDTYSDKGRGKRSVVGFTATTNTSFTKYFSTVKFQGVGQEIVDQLSECFEEALTSYQSINGYFPSEVIVYRDGVGDGQFMQVFNYEVPQIKQILLRKNPATKLTVVIVQKRISTRIFDHTQGGVSNPLPGTVVDSGCTNPRYYDFFMVNQSVNQGTATPTHYHVILDEINLPAANMQLLTFKLGHLYFNWAGTIRVPAPCQYAHKIAFLVGQAVHAAPHTDLSNLLHFL